MGIGGQGFDDDGPCHHQEQLTSRRCQSRIKANGSAHISFAIARVSAKEQQELAMCWCWDRVSKMYGSAIVIDTRTKGSKGFLLVEFPRPTSATNTTQAAAESCRLSAFCVIFQIWWMRHWRHVPESATPDGRA